MESYVRLPATPQTSRKQLPRKGFLFFRIPLQACLHKVDEKQKNHAQHGSCFLFAKREQGDREAALAAEHPLQLIKLLRATVDEVHKILLSLIPVSLIQFNLSVKWQRPITIRYS